MWNWLKRLLGIGAHRIQGRLEIQPKPEPGQASEREWSWPSSADTPRKPPSLLELSKRRSPEPTERKMPRSFKNRPGVKQAQVNLKKAGYNPNAKIEEDPPRRRRW